MKKSTLFVIIAAVITMLVITGCQTFAAQATATLAPTYTPYPTYTSYPTDTKEPTAAATATKYPTATDRPTNTYVPVTKAPTATPGKAPKLDTTLKIKNRCDVTIVINMTGPMTLKITAPPKEITEVTIAKGTYNYTTNVGYSGTVDLREAVWTWTWC